MRRHEEHLAEIEDATILKELDASFLVEVDEKQVVIPKSQLRDGTTIKKVGDTGTLVIPQWLAEDRDLV